MKWKDIKVGDIIKYDSPYDTGEYVVLETLESKSDNKLYWKSFRIKVGRTYNVWVGPDSSILPPPDIIVYRQGKIVN